MQIKIKCNGMHAYTYIYNIKLYYIIYVYIYIRKHIRKVGFRWIKQSKWNKRKQMDNHSMQRLEGAHGS
jgi:hypothetical protein